ncbi:MAG: hypothetical protein J6U16_06390 [Ruminococcus sp.]|nr:hypothetical protein [Ruminococcus sp.]
MTKDILDKINKFTRREFAADELFAFNVILCDNDIDRDCERFSDNALEQLKALFVGKTGIFDHDASTSNQTARIFDTEVVTDTSRRNKCGEPYKYLRASAYMVRTDDNRDLIAEIDGGIKKEVSISCAVGKRRCSVCGADRAVQSCSHVKGKTYGGRLCHVVLDVITDAYEWSFVAVPAQVNAGVTKRFAEEGTEKSANAVAAENERLLRCEIRRLAFISGGRKAAFAAELAAHGLNEVQLAGMKKAYEKLAGRAKTEVQLSTEPGTEPQTSAFKL